MRPGLVALGVLIGTSVCAMAQVLPTCDLTSPAPLVVTSDEIQVTFGADDPLGLPVRMLFEWTTDSGFHWRACSGAATSPTANPMPARATPFAGAAFLWDTAVDRIALGDRLAVDLRATVFADHGLFSEGAQQLPFDDAARHFGDLDGDGDADLVTSSPFGVVSVWRNDGAGGLIQDAPTIYSWAIPDVGDVDGDGDLDIVAGSLGIEVWQNDGAAHFSTPGTIPGNTAFYDLHLADLDGDGDLDIFTVVPTGLAVWANDGAGNYAPLGPQTPFAPRPPLHAADLDGDGDLDILDTRETFLNDGNGYFSASGVALPEHDASSLGDADRDGDVDLFLCQDDGARLWLNDGWGVFVDSGQLLGGVSGCTLDAGDLDADGDIDAVIGIYNGPNRVWLNDGAGGFADAGVRLGSSCTTSVGVGDLDGDGDLDLIEGRHSVPGAVWFQDGMGEVQHSCTAAGIQIDNRPAVTITSPATAETVWRDVDVSFDGASPRPDAVSSTFEWSRDTGLTWAPVTVAGGSPAANPDPLRPGPFADAHLSWDTVADGIGLAAVENVQLRVRSLGSLGERGVYHDSGQSLAVGWSSSIAFGDLDGDGDVDAALPDPAGGCELWGNDGDGYLSPTGQSLGTATNAMVTAADLDGDTDLDLILARDNTVWWNDGAGTFSSSTLPFAFPSPLLSLACADLDGDGDLDVVQARSQSSALVWRNDGGGAFVDTGQRVGAAYGRDLELADVDGDGDLDFVHAGSSEPAQVWRNDGAGLFTDTGQVLGSRNIRDVCVADVDGDGNVDAILVTGGYANELWLNDGLGNYTDSGRPLSEFYRGALDDVDGDGDADLITADWVTWSVRVWWNDGLGSFADSGQVLASGDSYDVSLADLDGDGDRDLVVADGLQNRVHWNGARVVTDQVSLEVTGGPVCAITAGPGGTGDVGVQVEAGSLGGGPLDLLLEYSLDGGVTFSMCTPAVTSPSPNPLSGAGPGVHDLVWDTVSDGIGVQAPASVILRWTVDDGSYPTPGLCETGMVVANGCATACGDCNMDGVAGNLLDALVSAQIALGLRSPTAAQSFCCDSNGTGSVEILDCLLIAQHAAGLPVAFGCR